MALKNWKRSAYIKANGMRINCDGTSVIDRKPHLKLMPNHFRALKKSHRIFNPEFSGQAIRDGKGWYK